MNINSVNNDIILEDVQDFLLPDTFDCGQCIRWDRLDDKSYIGVAMGKALKISMGNKTVILHDTSEQDFRNIWQTYFDFDRNYGEVKRALSKDAVLKKAVDYGYGIHILKQDIWECLVSFIISASNHIPRIKKIISLLCENFGDKINYMGQVFYSFPTPEKIASLTLDDLQIIHAGFRDKYILSAAKMAVSGEIDIYGLAKSDTPTIKKELMRIPGVGNKVSDCILLFAYARHDSFPVDVWLKRIMEFYYFDNKQKIDDIQAFSKEKFGNLGGFAQQYLFFYGRENKIGI